MARKDQDYTITTSEEYKEYLSALCRCSSTWVASIRVQYARKAYRMYQDETVRKLVLKYGEEAKKADAYELREFTWASEEEDDAKADRLHGDCLNIASALAKTIHYLFEIDMSA